MLFRARAFDEWWSHLRSLAADHRLLWLIGNDQQAYYDSYVDGESVSDVLRDLCGYAAADDYLGRNIKEGE